VFVADDHALVRAGIKQILAEEPDIELVAEADNGNDVLRAVREQAYSVVVLDMSMPGRSGIELIKDLKRLRPSIRLLVLSMHNEDQYAMRAIKAGAHGYVTKTSAPTELITALRRIAAGGIHLKQELVDQLVLSIAEPSTEVEPHARLSDREYQVFLMLAHGQSVTDIAGELFLSSKTISTHKARILQKLGLANLAELIHYAMRQGLVDL
jgi:DNA-binding NarL/FixJ family response regulator